MTDWIGRYVYDVTRRLPEGERAEVEQELRANIYDMLPEGAGDEEIRAVLEQLGPPATLAEQYRQAPRYLISPAVYEDYIRALKWVVPLVGGILLMVGLVLAALRSLDGEATDMAGFMGRIISNGISMGLSGALQALVWTTLGFVIADRAGHKAAQKEWRPEELPEVQLENKRKISLADSIVELVLTAVFSALAIMFCAGALPQLLLLQHGSTRVYTLFGEGFLRACIPAIAVCGLLSVVECTLKIVYRRWRLPVCIGVLANGAVAVGWMLVLLRRPDIFSGEFLAFMGTLPFGDGDFIRLFGQSAGNPLLIFFGLIVVVVTVAECVVAVYRTAREYSRKGAESG